MTSGEIDQAHTTPQKVIMRTLLPELPTKSYFEAILGGFVQLDHIAIARILLESSDLKTRNVASEYYPKLWEKYHSRMGTVRSEYFGQHAPWGILLDWNGHYDCEYRREISSLAPVNWEWQLQRCEAAIAEVQHNLTGSNKSLILGELFGLIYMLFSVIDSAAASPESEIVSNRLNETMAFVEEALQRLEATIRGIFLGRQNRFAQQTYLGGMLPGLFLVGGVLAVLSIWTKVGAVGEVAAGAGSLGAILSVLARTTRAQTEKSLRIDHEVGGSLIFCAGLFRPIVGALFASAFYVLINSGIMPLKVPEGLQGDYFIAAIAFLSGFSERLAQDALVRTSRATF